MADTLGLGQPIPDDPTDPPANQFDDLTDQQVEDALAGKPLPPQYDDDAPTPEPDPEPEAPPVEAATPDPEPPAPQDQPQSAEERLAALEQTIRIERLEREKAEAKADRERYLHSRNAGELGYLKKMLADRQTQDQPYVEPHPEGADELTAIRNDIAAMKSERTSQAIAEELNDFQRTYPDAAKDESAMTVIMQRHLPDYLPLLNGGDPKMARTIVRSLLKESYAELRIEKEQATVNAATTRSYDQAAKLKARKIAAAPVAATRTAPLRAVPKSIDDLSDAEVDALADAYVRSSS